MAVRDSYNNYNVYFEFASIETICNDTHINIV